MTTGTVVNVENDNEMSDDEEVNDYESSGNEAGSSSEADESEGEQNDGTANTAWADSIAKILKSSKPKKKKTLVLSKAKKLTDVRTEKPKPAGYQVAQASGDVKDEVVDDDETPTDKPDTIPRKKKKDVLSVRVRPNVLDKDRERQLSKIATKGVVQLFNAVRMQQKDIKSKLEKAGPLEVRKDKVLKNIDKRAFLDVLMGEKSQAVDDEGESEKRAKRTRTETKDETWSVLRDDFMMGARMKDWDKELEMEGSDEAEIERNVESE